MAKVILRQKAIDDLNNIWTYTSIKWSEIQADKYYATIKDSCLGIGENPEVGKKYDGVSENLLGLKAGRHIIFYQSLSEGRIEVLRILHERMDLKNENIRIKYPSLGFVMKPQPSKSLTYTYFRFTAHFTVILQKTALP